jgi:DNA-binding MarR family transcriptional regulator
VTNCNGCPHRSDCMESVIAGGSFVRPDCEHGEAPKLSPCAQRILTRLRVCGPATTADLRQELGIHSHTVTNTLRDLARAGLVRHDGQYPHRRYSAEVLP